jgi:hypothetical protein
MSADYDSPWKEALDLYFEKFLLLLFPKIHRRIDWSRGHESLDKEFQQVVRDAEVGRRYVDKLVKIWTKRGSERLVLVHVEVQTTRDEGFAERMYVYNYRVRDRYNRKVASLAVLADDDPNWRPRAFHNSVFGCRTGIRFPIAKLLDFAPHEAMLETSDNPFAKVVLAHLKALQTRNDPVNRSAWKIWLVRGLYERGLSKEDARELLRVIDWLMDLPPALNESFQQELDKIQKENTVPFVTSFERYGIRKGLCEGIEAMLRYRFHEEGLPLMPEIRKIYEEDKLREILNSLETAENVDAVRRLLPPATE